MGLAPVWAPKSIPAFERAVEIDPEFAEAWGELAMDHLQLGWAVGFDREAFLRAKELAEKALALDERLGRAHAIIGHAKLWTEWDFAGAERSFARGVELSPGDPHTLDAYSWHLLMVGRPKEAIALTERTLQIAPLDLYMREAAWRHFMLARDYERALAELEHVRALDPDWIAIDLAAFYFILGRTDDAYRASVEFDRRCGEPCAPLLQARERGWAEDGWEGSLRAWIPEARESGFIPPLLIAHAYLWLGENEAGLDWLERGVRDRDPWMQFLKVMAFHDPLRDDPRFEDLLRRVGFPGS
jgi:tetratricopeptide (TPR) repeat protein